MGVETHTHTALRRHLGKPLANLERVGHLLPEIVDQHIEVVLWERLMEHLGCAQRASGIADERMRHGSETLLAAEIMRGGVVGVADEALGIALSPGPCRADTGGIGHHLGHLGTCAMPCIHGQETHIGKIGAHGVGVEGGDTGRAELLQEDGLEVTESLEGAGDVHHGLTGPDPAAFFVEKLDFEPGSTFALDPSEPIECQPRRAEHRAAHEDRISDTAVAEALDDGTCFHEIFVAVGGDLVARRPVHDQIPSRPTRLR